MKTKTSLRAGDVATNDLGPDNIQKKHVTNFNWTGTGTTGSSAT
jgi:hypothetical protein